MHLDARTYMKFLLLTRGSPCDNYDCYILPLNSIVAPFSSSISFLKNRKLETRKLSHQNCSIFPRNFFCRSGLSVADVTISTVVGMTGLIHASAVHSPVARFESAWFVPVVWSRFMLASVSGPNGLQIGLIRNFSFQNEIVLNLHAILVFLLHNLYAILLKWTF